MSYFTGLEGRSRNKKYFKAGLYGSVVSAQPGFRFAPAFRPVPMPLTSPIPPISPVPRPAPASDPLTEIEKKILQLLEDTKVHARRPAADGSVDGVSEEPSVTEGSKELTNKQEKDLKVLDNFFSLYGEGAGLVMKWLELSGGMAGIPPELATKEEKANIKSLFKQYLGANRRTRYVLANQMFWLIYDKIVPWLKAKRGLHGLDESSTGLAETGFLFLVVGVSAYLLLKKDSKKSVRSPK